MKKVAVFVEGQTEQVFTEELFKHMFGHAMINIETLQFSGGTGIRQIRTIRSLEISSSTKYFIRIYDCHGGGNNSTVKSDIIEQFPYLVKESFSYIIGIRDVYPLPDLELLRNIMHIGLPNDIKLPIKMVLAVREVESWFLAEENHYLLIDALLTTSFVNKMIGFDITTNSTETIDQPSITLKKVYQTVGKDYNKKKWETQRTVHCIDYDNLYLAVRNRNNSLNELLTCLDGLIP